MKSRTVRKPRRAANLEHWARRQEEILDAAVRLFAVNNYAETDTQVLADELRVGKGTLYRYFPSKRALFLAAADRVMQQLRACVEAAIAGLDDPLERIAKAVRTYLKFFAEHPEYAELLIQERAQFKDRKKPTYHEHCDASVERWREMYRSLIAAGRVRNIPPERITDVISDLLYGTMFTSYFTGRQKSYDQQADDLLDIVFHGILTGPERRRRGAE
jgi:AcrR family transcriptional regulator